MHLRDADLLRDLRLGQPLEEAQVKDHPLALVEHAEARLENRAILGDLVLVLLGSERLEGVEVAVVVLPRPRRERERAVGPAALERLEHFLFRDLGSLGELGDRGRAPELDRQLLEQPGELDVQLLEAARHAHRPAAVAEVTLDLADDVRRRIGGQLDAAVDVEAVDRLDQPDRADLNEVLELLAAVGVPAGQGTDERHVLLDQLLAGSQVSVLVVAAQEGLVALVRHQAVAALSIRFCSSIHSAPSRSIAPNPSTTVSSTRRRSTPAGSCSSSARSASEANGPIVAVMTSSPSTSSTVRSPSSPRRSSRVASAVPRSSITSKVRSSRAATPPRTSWATSSKPSSRGIVSRIRSSVTARPLRRPHRLRKERPPARARRRRRASPTGAGSLVPWARPRPVRRATRTPPLLSRGLSRRTTRPRREKFRPPRVHSGPRPPRWAAGRGGGG